MAKYSKTHLKSQDLMGIKTGFHVLDWFSPWDKNTNPMMDDDAWDDRGFWV